MAVQRTLQLRVLDGDFAICKLPANSPTPEWAQEGIFHSITRTPDELSLVCSSGLVPEGIECNTGWCCLRVEGPLDFALTGVLSSLAAPMAKANIPIFVVSTFDTDYLLVKGDTLMRAVETLTQDGHDVRDVE